MTFLLAPMPTTDVRPPKRDEPAEVRIVAWEMLPGSAFSLDSLVGTNDSFALPSAGTVVVSDWATSGVASAEPREWSSLAALISDIRDMTQFTMSQLSALLGVERRSLYFWLQGKSASSEHRHQLQELWQTTQRLAGGRTQSQLREALRGTWIAPAPVPAASASVPDRSSRGVSLPKRLPLLSPAVLLMREEDGVSEPVEEVE